MSYCYFHPLGVSIYNNQVHLPKKWACIIYMKSRPWVLGVLPGMEGCLVGLSQDPWQSEQDLTIFSKSVSILGHHTKPLATPFMSVMPGCVSCNSAKIWSRLLGGTTTLHPQKIHPSSTFNSSFLLQKDMISGVPSLGHPFKIQCLTFASTEVPVSPFLNLLGIEGALVNGQP